MAGHTNNAALNEAARLEHERLRKDADKACTDYTAVYLSGFADGKAEQQARIAELERRLAETKATEQAAYELSMRTTTELVEAREENTRLKAELEHKLADALQSVQSWQMEVAGRDADIERLERELAESHEEAKKWEKRFEFLANKVLAGIPCQSVPNICDGCHEETYEICRDRFIAAADREE